MSAALATQSATTAGRRERNRRRLIESGFPDVERSSLHRALDEGRYQAVLYQLKLGMDPNVRSRHGLTPLMRCAQVRPPSASLHLIRVLLERGANPDLTDSGGNNLLQVAVRESNTVLVRLLLTENNVNFHHRNSNGDTVLHLLAGQSPELCRMVLRAARRFHIDCDLGNADGVTPMMAACRAGNLPIAELFASSGGASLTKRDTRRRWTAYDWLRIGLGGAGGSGKLDQQWLQRLRHPELPVDPYQQIRESRRLETLSRLFRTSQQQGESGQVELDEDQDVQVAEHQTAAETSHFPPVSTTRQASQLQLQDDSRSRSSQSSFCRAAADSRISQARLVSGIFDAYEWHLTNSYRRPAVPLPASAIEMDDGADRRPGSRPHSRLSSGRSQRSPVNSGSGNVLTRRMTEFTGAGMRLKQRIRSGARLSENDAASLLLNTSQDSGGLRRLSSKI